MEDKFLIFNKNIPLIPMSKIDDCKNSHVSEFSKDDAIKYVNELNKECGKEIFVMESINGWEKQKQSPRAQALFEKMDDVMEKMVKDTGLGTLIEEINRNSDKNIKGFSIPFEADSNEDYEKKLKERLTAFVKEIDRPAFREEDNLVDDVKNICQKVINAFEAAKSGENENAEKIIAEIIEDYKKYSFAVSDLDKSYAFRGIAPFKELRQNWVDLKVYEDMLEGDLNFLERELQKQKNKFIR